MADRKLLDDCFLHDKDRIRHDECISLITGRLSAVAGVEKLPLEDAAGRYSAETITAPRNVPLHDNSAVDGYAFAHLDYLANRGRFPVTDRITAGDIEDHILPPGGAVRIFTGARMPSGADTVVMQEDCDVTGGGAIISVPEGLKPGANCRKSGEDLRSGDSVVGPGTRLRPQELAALASLGVGSVSMHKRLRIALLSTGNEIIQPGTSIAPGLVYDSNRIMLKSLAQSLPVLITDLGVVADSFTEIEKQIALAAAGHDLIVTTGGASLGEEDHIIEAIDKLGKRHLWQVAIKPGRPMSVGQIGDCVFLGLPGNPVAAFVCFLMYGRPAITVLGGGNPVPPLRVPVPAGFAISKKKPDRREFLRGWLEAGENGAPVARKFQRDGSGLISGLRQANGFIDLPEHVTSVAEGEPVSFIPFSEFGINS